MNLSNLPELSEEEAKSSAKKSAVGYYDFLRVWSAVKDKRVKEAMDNFELNPASMHEYVDACETAIHNRELLSR